MSDDTSPREPLPALTAPPPAGRDLAGRLRHPATLLAVAALLGVVVLGWLDWRTGDRLDTTRQELARRLADAEAAQREARAQAQQNREVLDAAQARLGLLETRFSEMQSQQLALEAMYQELSRTRDDRLLAEIEHDVSLAAQQLQFAGNVEAALIVLQGAEARLVKNAQPQFATLRRMIVRDIERLKAAPVADVPGIALKIDAVLSSVPGMPLAFEQRPVSTVPAAAPGGQPDEADAPPGWQGMFRAWAGDLWREVRQLVRIERIDRPDPGLLAPREVFFLRENLRLRLLSARLGLLARDMRSFRSDLRQAGEWLDLYFDPRAAQVQEARATLAALGRLEPARETADLGETLSALRNFKLARDRGTAR